MKITPAKLLKGEVRMPGDKSISHRAAMLAAIADGKTRISNFAASADCASTLDCVTRLGIQVGRHGSEVEIMGRGKYGLSSADQPLDCGNSGTTMRLISGILAGQEFETELTGDGSLRSRPMGRVIEPLTQMGAEISSSDGRAPLKVHGVKPLQALEYTLPVASAQIKSCVLLAGLLADGKTSVFESTPTRDHTERMLRWFGVDLEVDQHHSGTRISIDGNSHLTGRDLTVPGDISAAAFFIVAATCLPGSEITMPDVGMNPSRAAVCDLLRDLGANIEISTLSNISNEPVADVRVRGGITGRRSATPVIRGKAIANLIDEIPVLAVLGTQLPAGIEFRDAAELRVKETDRIAAVCSNLKLMNADVEEFEDGFRVSPSQLRGEGVPSFGDHRIAMAFAVAGLFAEGETEIEGAECAGVSFPTFFETLATVVR